MTSKEFGDFSAMLQIIMRLFPAYLLLALLALPLPGGAEIYTWTDSAGRVHFTDSPPENATSRKIDITPANTYNAPSQESINETLSRPTGIKKRKPNVTVYSTTWCGVCKKAKRWLHHNKIPFREYDVETSAKGQQDYKKMKGRGVPIIKIGKQRLNGFSPTRLTQALRQAGYPL